MANYQKMYAILCSAVDDALDTLYQIPKELPTAYMLQTALERAEELYIQTSAETEEQDNLIKIHFQTEKEES